MCSQAQAALAPGGVLWGPSVGVNLKQQADIPVGSVTVHACVMMPGWQVTQVQCSGGRVTGVASSYVSSEFSRMKSGLGGTVIK